MLQDIFQIPSLDLCNILLLMMHPVLHPEVSQCCHKVKNRFLIYVLNQLCAAHRMINPQIEEDDYSEEIIASSFEFFVYFFAHISISDKEKNLDLNHTSKKLSDRVFHSRIIDNFDVQLSLTKSAANHFKLFFIPFKLGNSDSCLIDIRHLQ